MSDAKISKLQARIDEVMGRESYASTPAWRQEVAELRLEIEALKAGRKAERKEFVRAEVKPSAAPAAVATAEHDEDHDDHHAPYMAIFWTLALLTLLEWKYAQWFGVEGIPLWTALGLMAIVKAVLVALFFMHLKFERRTMYALLALPFVLVIVIMSLVSPDSEQHVGDYEEHYSMVPEESSD